MTVGLARSVHPRLVRHAHERGTDPNVVLARFAAERLLFRLSRSADASRFVLKGAMMLVVWLGETLRPTRDADLLGFGELDAASFARTFRDLCTLPVEPDGLRFFPDTVQVEPIRAEDAYGGQRVTLVAHLGSARLRVQIDVGIGDAVVPEPRWIEYPSLLDLPRPRLLAYQRETAVAEVEGKAAQWQAFLRRVPGAAPPARFETVIDALATFAGPVLLAVGRATPFTAHWTSGGPWR